MNGFKYSKDKKNWVPVNPEQDRINQKPIEAETLRVVSWNVLFDDHLSDQIYSKDRLVVCLKDLCNTNADIIGLQEVTAPFIEALEKEEWVRSSYYISEIPGNGGNWNPISTNPS